MVYASSYLEKTGLTIHVGTECDLFPRRDEEMEALEFWMILTVAYC